METYTLFGFKIPMSTLMGIGLLVIFVSQIILYFQNKTIMESQNEMQDAIQQMTNATTAVGERINTLIATVENSAASEADRTAALTAIKAETAALIAMAPTNPTGGGTEGGSTGTDENGTPAGEEA